MKNLNTLVPDIYEALQSLANGEALDIPDETIDDLGEKLKDAVRHWATPRKRDTDFTLRMSNIGRPLRQLWFDSRADVHPSSHDASSQIKFLYGHLLEEVLLFLVRLSGHEVTNEQKEVEVDGIVGHMDCKIDGEVVDVKTASRFAFNKFAKGTLSQDDPFGYLSQLAGYETAEGSELGGFLVINKETGELCLYRPDDIEKPNIKHKISQIREALTLDNPPELCYTPVPHGKKGNMKIHKNCVYCPYKHQCFEDLRVFKYSNGLVYLSHVEDEPSVEEVL